MRRQVLLAIALGAAFYFLFVVVHSPRQGTETPFHWNEIKFDRHDRILVLAPHPDDESLCCGGIIQQATTMGLPVRVVFLTYGDSNQWSFLVYRKRPVFSPKVARQMGLVRHKEALAASKALGLSPEHLTFLGYPDFGTLPIWYSYWGNRHPFRGILTKVTTVPYQNALRPGASYKGEEILQDLKTVLREFRPTKVFVSHPADYNPDHRALYLFTRVALWDLEEEIRIRPKVYPYLIHFKQWPRPRGYHPESFLKPPSFFKEEISWSVFHVSDRWAERKRIALTEHKTQYGYRAKYLLSFARADELFGDFQAIALRPSSSPASLLPHGAEGPEKTSEELSEQERAAFVGFEERSAQLENGQLVLSIKFSRPLAETVEASVYIFGYRRDRPFAQMPKLHVKFGAITHEVYDQERKLSQEILQVERKPRELTLRIPLQILGDPQRILTSAQTYLGDVPLDWASWRVLELTSGT